MQLKNGSNPNSQSCYEFKLDQSIGLSHLLTIWISGCGFGESLTTGYNSAIVILSISWNMFNVEGQQAFKNDLVPGW